MAWEHISDYIDGSAGSTYKSNTILSSVMLVYMWVALALTR